MNRTAMHLPGQPVRDSAGEALAPHDGVNLRGPTGVGWRAGLWQVTAVHTEDGTVTAALAGQTRTVPGGQVQLRAPYRIPAVPDTGLEQMDLDLARTLVQALATRCGRYPRLVGRYDTWVFGRTWGRRVFADAGVLFGARERVLMAPQSQEFRNGQIGRWVFSTARRVEVPLPWRQLSLD